MDSGIETLLSTSTSSSRNSRKSSLKKNTNKSSPNPLEEQQDTINCNDPLQRRRGSSSSSSTSTTTNVRSRTNAIPDDQSNHGHSGDGEEENQLSINKTYKIPILGYEVMEERAKFTVFKLRVEHEQLNENWLVFRRYTDFERLYAKLKEEYPLLAINLPPKRWLRDNFESAFLEDRMKGLQAFVDSILLRHKLTHSPTVREFFCFDDPPVHSSENSEEAHSLFDETRLSNTLSAKQTEIEVLTTELLLMKTQYENLLRLTKNCGHCNIQQRRSSLTVSPPENKNMNMSTNTESPTPAHSTPIKPSDFESVSFSNSTSKKKNHTGTPKLSSSSSSSTSTSYSEIMTKNALKLNNDGAKNKKRSSADTKLVSSTLPSSAHETLTPAITINYPRAPQRKPRKSVPVLVTPFSPSGSGRKTTADKSFSTKQDLSVSDFKAGQRSTLQSPLRSPLEQNLDTFERIKEPVSSQTVFPPGEEV